MTKEHLYHRDSVISGFRRRTFPVIGLVAGSPAGESKSLDPKRLFFPGLVFSGILMVCLAAGLPCPAVEKTDTDPSAPATGTDLDDAFFDSDSPITVAPKPEQPANSDSGPIASKPSGKQEQVKAARLPLGDVLPRNVLAFVRVGSLRTLDEKGQYILNRLGLGVFSPLGWFKMSAYGKMLDSLDQEAQLALAYNDTGNSVSWMFILPVTDFRSFASATGATPDENPKEGQIFPTRNPPDCYVWSRGGYAVLANAPNEEMARKWANEKSFLSQGPFATSGVKSSHLVLEVTPEGISCFSRLARAALADSQQVFTGAQDALKIQLVQGDLLSLAGPRIDRFVQFVQHNLDRLRVDLVVEKDTTLTSVSMVPRPNSELEAQMQDPSVSVVQASLDLNRPLKILPDVPAPLAGQADLSPSVASRLQPPFNRIRHLEYSIGLPGEGQLLAESFSFFLEVDDANLFVKELILPKAQLIGSRMGSERLGEIGAQLLGNFATRRQVRTGGRARIDPGRAADLGARLGSQIGAGIGSSVAQQEAMRLYDFEGAPMLRTDMVLYQEQMNKIRAEDEGRLPPKTILLTGEPSMRIFIGQVLSGIMSGNGTLQDMIRSSIGGDGNYHPQEGDPPLFARENLILLLDKQHILICPGNAAILSAAKHNWESLRSRYQPFDPMTATDAGPLPVWQPGPQLPPQDTVNPKDQVGVLVAMLRSEVPNLDQHTIRTVTEFDLSSVDWFAQYLRKWYAPQLATPLLDLLPADTPAILSLSTTRDDTGFLYSVFPHQFARNLIQSQLQLKNQTKVQP